MEVHSSLLALCEGNPLVTSRFSLLMARYVDLYVFFIVIHIKMHNKQLSCQWFEMS